MVFIEVIIIVAVLFSLSYLLFWVIDKKAKEYSELPSEELLEKAVSGKNIMSIGMTFMATGGVIAIVSCLIPLIIGICSGPLEILPANWSSISFTIGGVATMYSMIVPMLIGLLVFSAGSIKTGMVSRALNMYSGRKLQPWEDDFVNQQINIEETAQKIRLGQIAGNILDSTALQAKGAVDTYSFLQGMGLESKRWVILVTIIGLIIAEIIFVGIYPIF